MIELKIQNKTFEIKAFKKVKDYSQEPDCICVVEIWLNGEDVIDEWIENIEVNYHNELLEAWRE